MNYFDILLAQKTGYIPRNHFDALFARKIGGAILKDFPDLPASIVTVTDALAKPLDSLKVAITPVQSGSGDPSPDNIRPISGWTGCNVFENGVNFMEVSEDNFLVSTGTANIENGKIIVTTDGLCRAGLILRVKPGHKYRFRMTRESGGYSYGYLNAWFDKPTNYSGGKEIAKETFSSNKSWVVTYTVPENINWVYLFMYKSSGARRFTISEMSARIDNTSTYEPYTGQDYTIAFPSEAGTVYGGTLDVVNGVLTVDKLSIDLSTLSWSTTSWGGYRYDIPNADGARNASTLADIYCDRYANSTYSTVSGKTNNTICLGGSVANAGRVYVYDSENTPTGTLVYPLTEPVTYQLTPTEITMLLGTNNLWADTGDILEGKYWCKRSSATRAMLNALRDAGEITRITEPEEPEEPEESDER